MKPPWRKTWQPTTVFLPGESLGTEKLRGLQPKGSQRVRHGWVTKHISNTCHQIAFLEWVYVFKFFPHWTWVILWLWQGEFYLKHSLNDPAASHAWGDLAGRQLGLDIMPVRSGNYLFRYTVLSYHHSALTWRLLNIPENACTSLYVIFTPLVTAHFSVHPPSWSLSSVQPALFHNIKVQSRAWSPTHSQYLWMENCSCTSACPKLRALGWIILLWLAVFKSGKKCFLYTVKQKSKLQNIVCFMISQFCKMEEEVGRQTEMKRSSETRRPRVLPKVGSSCSPRRRQQNAQVTLGAHKLSSRSDNVRTNWQKCLIILRAQKRGFPECTSKDLLSPGARQLVQIHVSIPPRKSIHWQPLLGRGETETIPKTNGCGSC